MRTLIGHTTDASVRENGFSDLVGDFAIPPVNPGKTPAPMNAPAPAAAAGDVSKTNTASSAQTDKLKDQIRQFRQAFKTKYGEDFAIKDAQTLYGDINASNLNEAQAQPAAAEIKGNPANGQTTPPPSANPAPPAANAGAENTKDAINAPRWSTLTVPEYQGAPAVTIHLVREGNAFKYVSMQPVNQQALTTNLTDWLAKVNDNQSHWPRRRQHRRAAGEPACPGRDPEDAGSRHERRPRPGEHRRE